MADTVWITGASGFVGSHLLSYLRSLADRPRVVGLDRTEPASGDLDAFSRTDVRERSAVTALAERDPPSRVLHLAAALPPAGEAEMWHVNAGGTAGLLLGLRDAGCKDARVLCVGSAAEYLSAPAGPIREENHCGGETVYGLTKWAQTTVALEMGKTLGIPAVVARVFNLTGPGLPSKFVAGELCAQFARGDGEPIRVGNTTTGRDFVDVRDVVRAFWALLEKGTAGEVYNVCSGQCTLIADLCSLFAELTNRPLDFVTDPSKLREKDLDRVYGDNAKIREATRWQPRISLRRSISEMLVEARK